jgi:hypothetical protein
MHRSGQPRLGPGRARGATEPGTPSIHDRDRRTAGAKEDEPS